MSEVRGIFFIIQIMGAGLYMCVVIRLGISYIALNAFSTPSPFPLIVRSASGVPGPTNFFPTHFCANNFMLCPVPLAGVVTKTWLDDATRSSNVSSNVRHLAPLLVSSDAASCSFQRVLLAKALDATV